MNMVLISGAELSLRSDLITSLSYIFLSFYCRNEYINLYHTFTEWYNVFLVMNFFNLTREHTNILFVDGHPRGHLDYIWGELFNSTLRLGSLTEPVMFNNLIFGWCDHLSPIDPRNEKEYQEMPLLEEFREFLLETYGLPIKKSLNCISLTLTIVWRRDNYVVHPRNPSGMCENVVNQLTHFSFVVQRNYFAIRFNHFGSFERRKSWFRDNFRWSSGQKNQL